MKHRPERVSNLITVELGKIMLEEVETPSGVLLTITEVAVSKDLEHANVKVSIYPSEHAEKLFKVLQKRQGELQFILSRKLNIRPMPRILFQLDFGMEKAARVEKALIEEEKK